METKAKLICKVNKTIFLPETFPTYYCGMPNNKVYIIYSRPYKIPHGQFGIELVIAVLREFSYDYEKEQLKNYDKKIVNMAEADLNGYNEKMRPIKVSRTHKTFKQAESLLNKLIKPKLVLTKPPKGKSMIRTKSPKQNQ
jgi:hypothetical protein